MTPEENLLDPSNIQPPIPKFEDAVGEGKKWKDGDTLLKSKIDSDSYVKTLEMRLDDFRDMYLKLKEQSEKQTKLEDLVKQLDQRPQPQPLTNSNTPANEVQPAFKPEDLIPLMQKQIQEDRAVNKQQENANLVKAKLIERFGLNYPNIIQDQIQQLGLTTEDFNSLARKSPAALFKTLGLEDTMQRESFQAPPRSNVQFQPRVEQKHKPKSYYAELKKSNPRLYMDPKVLNKMEEDSQALGEAFFDV